LAVTRMAGPAELMAQEGALLEHLQSADAIEVVEDGMFLSRDGLFAMELERRGTWGAWPSFDRCGKVGGSQPPADAYS